MNKGSLSERHLKKVVLNQIHKINDDLVYGPKVGNDYSYMADGLISAEGVGSDPYIAFYKALNNFNTSLGTYKYANTTCLYPVDIKESCIKEMTGILFDLSSERDIQILGGNSKILEEVSKATFVVEIIGRSTDMHPTRNVKSGDYEIVVVNEVSMLGTNMLIDKYSESLQNDFSQSFLDTAKVPTDRYSIEKAIDVIKSEDLANECDIAYIHDVSDGGIYRCLWQVGELLNKGLTVDNKLIPIHQQTIEICESLDKNPYMIDGTGAAVVVCKNGEKLVSVLEQNGIVASVVGKLTEDKERKVYFAEDEYRKLSPED